MGWTGEYGRKYTNATSRKAKVNELFNYKNSQVLDIAASRNDTYAAVKDVRDNSVFAVVVLFENRKDEGMYKVMSEDEHPYYYNCPNRILKQLTETESESAQQWRKECILAKSQPKAYRIVAKPPWKNRGFGLRVNEENPYEVYRTKISEATPFSHKGDAHAFIDRIRVHMWNVYGLHLEVRKA